MQYIALLYGAEGEGADPTSEAFAQELKRYERFGETAGDAIVGGEALAPSSEAVTIRHRPDGPVVTDGPHSEAAEVIGGLYVLERTTWTRLSTSPDRSPRPRTARSRSDRASSGSSAVHR